MKSKLSITVTIIALTTTNVKAACSNFNQNTLNHSHQVYRNCDITQIKPNSNMSYSVFIDSKITLTNANNLNFTGAVFKNTTPWDDTNSAIRLYGETKNVFFNATSFNSSFIFLSSVAKYDINATKKLTKYGISFEHSKFNKSTIIGFDNKSISLNKTSFVDSRLAMGFNGITLWNAALIKNTTFSANGFTSFFNNKATVYFLGTRLYDVNFSSIEVTSINPENFAKIQNVNMKGAYKLVNGKKVPTIWKTK